MHSGIGIVAVTGLIGLLLATGPASGPSETPATQPTSQPATRPAEAVVRPPVTVRAIIERMPAELRPAQDNFWTDAEAKRGALWIQTQLAGERFVIDAEDWHSWSRGQASPRQSFECFGRRWDVSATCMLTEAAERAIEARKKSKVKTKRLRFTGRATSGECFSGNPMRLHLNLSSVTVGTY